MIKISAGSYVLDKWLHGGYETGIITTIYGPAGSGKTNFCMLVAIEQAKKGKIIYIDTEGGFSVERLKQICEEENILSNILLLKPTNFSEQKEAFKSMLDELKKTNTRLVIIDGITMLYRLELAAAKRDNEKIREVNSELATEMRMLAEIARKKDIAVIVTNQVYTDFREEKGKEEKEKGEKEIHMVGGDILKYWSKCIIELQNLQGKKKAILRKHRSLPEKELNFVITGKGIEKSSWLF